MGNVPRRGRNRADRTDPRRRAVALGLPLGAVLLAAGCVSIGGGDASAPTWFLLEDRGVGAAGAPSGTGATEAAGPNRAQQGDGNRGSSIDRVLLVAPVLASSFYDSPMLAYSKAPGTRAHYQFAGWTERPARRVGVLVERRLAAGGRFAAVAQSVAGVRGDMLLNLTLEDLYHDVSSSPGGVRIAMVAELLQWRGRTLVARRAFEQTAPVSREAADAAADAFNRAIAALLDQLSVWVEAQVQRAVVSG